jgi:hypothetical protein
VNLCRCSRGLLAAGVSVIALAGGVGVAHSEPPPSPPPVPSIVDQPVPPTATVWVDPDDEGGPTTPWGGFGLFCEKPVDYLPMTNVFVAVLAVVFGIWSARERTLCPTCGNAAAVN